GTPDFAALVPAGSMPSMDEVQLADDGGDVVLGRGIADRLHVRAGAEVTVHATTGTTALRVAGVVSSPVLDRINGGMIAAMPLAPAQKVFGRAGRVDQIMVLAAPTADLDALRRSIGATVDGIGIVGSPGETAGGSANF